MSIIWRAIVAGVLLTSAQAYAQTPSWPVKPIRFVLSQNAGTAPDIVCRFLVDRLSTALGQSIVVENRGGGNNVIGTTVAARATPDGYTFHFGTGASLVTNVYTFKTLEYDPQKDFVPVAMAGKSAFLLVGSRSFPARTLRDVIDADKARPGTIAVASTGPRMFSGILGSWLNKVAGMNLLQVPYAQNAQGLQDTVAGRTPLNLQAVTPVLPFVRSGDLIPIAVSSSVRDADLPDVQTMAETLPGFEFVGWFALVAPTGTPKIAIDRINAELEKILDQPEVVARLRGFGMYNDGEGRGSPEKLAGFFAAEHGKWAKLVREIGITPE